MLSKCNLFYAEPTFKEVYGYEKYRAGKRNEELTREELIDRTERRLARYTRLDSNENSIRKAIQIKNRLTHGCLRKKQLAEIDEDIAIASVAIIHFYIPNNMALCISNNYDFWFIQCAAPKNLEVWSDLDPEDAQPPYSKLKLSMEEAGIKLNELD